MLDATDGVGGRIRAARRTADLTQRELADRLDVSLGTIERFETGLADATSYLEAIADATTTDAAWLRDGDGLSDGREQLDALGAALVDRERVLARSEARLREGADAMEAGWLRLREAQQKWAASIKASLAATEARESAIVEREAELDRREAELSAGRASDDQAENGLAEREAAAEAHEQAVARARAEVERRVAMLESRAASTAVESALDEATARHALESAAVENDRTDAALRRHEAPDLELHVGEAVRAEAVGSSGITLPYLETLVERYGGESPEQLDLWRAYLGIFREQMTTSGALPNTFDELVYDVFGELLHRAEAEAAVS